MKGNAKISEGAVQKNISAKGEVIGKDKEIKLKRELGLLEAVAITVGAIIGSGIFISPKGIISHVGSVGMSLVIWVVCGLVSIIGAFSYAELGTMFPTAGGHYTYIFEAFGPLCAFLSIWSSTILFAPVANATLALIVAKYVTQPFFSHECKISDAAVQLIAAAGLALLTFINCCDIRKTTRFVNTFLLLKISAVVIIIIGGLYAICLGKTENFQDIWQDTRIEAGGLVLAIFSGSFAFAGWQALTYMMEELKEPEKNLPRAIWISLITVMVVYLLANIAYFSVLSPQEMIASDAVAVTFVEKLVGIGTIGWTVPLFVALSTFGSLSIHILTTSRQCMVGAREGQLPKALSFITASNQTPTISIIFLSSLSMLYLCVSDVFLLITFSSITGGFFSLMSIAALLYLRWSKPDLHRPFKVSLVFPITYGIICLALIFIPMYTNPLTSAIGAIITLSGLPVYYLFIMREKQHNWLSKVSERTTEVLQKIFLSMKED